MKIIEQRTRTYGIGSNPSGGIAIAVEPENEADVAWLTAHGRRPAVGGRYWPYPIYRDTVCHAPNISGSGTVPFAGPRSSVFDAILAYMGITEAEFFARNLRGMSFPAPERGEPITGDTVIDIKIEDGNPVAYCIGSDGDGTDMPLV